MLIDKYLPGTDAEYQQALGCRRCAVLATRESPQLGRMQAGDLAAQLRVVPSRLRVWPWTFAMSPFSTALYGKPVSTGTTLW